MTLRFSIATLFSLIVAFSMPAFAAYVPLNKIIAIADDGVITQADLEQQLSNIAFNLKKQIGRAHV